MKKHFTLYIFIFTLFIGFAAQAQTVFRGTVIDAATKQPIANARVGINNQGVGEITNGKGFFNYKKYHEVVNSESQLVVGASGYESLQLDATQVRQLFNRSSKIELQPSSKQKETKKVNNLTIFWDVSEDMKGRDIDAEIGYVQAYVSVHKDLTLRLVAFDYKVRTDERIVVRGGDISRFRESVKALVYNGPSNYDILDSTGADAVILSSNGNPNYGTLNVSQDIPVYAIASEAIEVNEEYMRTLGQYTQGTYKPIKSNEGSMVQSTATTRVFEGSVIRGTVTSLGKPLQEVSIIKKGDLTEYLTDADGTFELPAKEGDILQLRYLGMFPKEILIENQDDLDIELLPKNDTLEEVVIESRYKQIIVGSKYVRGEKYKKFPGGITSRGDFFLTSEDIESKGLTLDDVIKLNFSNNIKMGFGQDGRFFTVAGVAPQWVLDGIPLTKDLQEPPLYLQDFEIESIIVKESEYSTFRFGPEIEGPAIIVTTKKVPLAKEKYVSSALVKNNEYTEEVSSISDGIISDKMQVKGKVTSLGKPIQGATISVKGSFEEFTSQQDGSFTANLSVGDMIKVHYLGMYPKLVVIDDETKEIEVDLLPKSDMLDEVEITGKAKESSNKRVDVENGRYNDPFLGSFNVQSLTREDTNIESWASVALGISGRFSNVEVSSRPGFEEIKIRNTPAIYYLNGIPVDKAQFFAVNPQNIATVSVKKDIGGVVGRAVLIDTVDFVSPNTPVPSALVKGNDYEEEVPSLSSDMVTNTSQITGKITSLGKPIQGATISKKGTFEEYTSKADGSFTLPTEEGDVWIVYYLGMYPKSFVVEDKTSYTIDLVSKNNVLDEVIVNAEGEEKIEEKVQTAWGIENKDKVGYDVKVLRKEDIFQGAPDLGVVLNGKFAGISAVENPRLGLTVSGRSGPMLIVIDGSIFPSDVSKPFISPDRVESVSIIKSVTGAVRYGSIGGNGVVEITTSNFASSKTTPVPSALVKGNDYEEEVKAIGTNTLPSSSKLAVTGIVKDLKGALADATITRKGSFDEVFTDTQGRFEIKAALGDVLVVSKAGMFTKEVLVESQNVGIIALTPKNDNLDEVIVSGDKRVDNTIERSDGKRVNKDKLGYAAQELTENNFADGATNLQQLITGKVSGVTVEGGLYSGSQVVYKIRGGNMSITNEIPPIWIVNGIPYPDPPDFLDVQQIASITVLKSASATSRYGTLAAGGAFLIKTKEVSFQDKAQRAQKSALVSGNEYTESTTGNIDTSTLPSYILRLREIPNLQEQFELYQRISRTQESPLEFYVDVAQYFDGINKEMADQVRADLAYISRNNTKALRTLCYIYEAAGDYDKAALIYERILKLAPSEAQSYRDLALIYQEIGKYNEALELYYNMLGEQIKGVNFQGLEKSIKNELSHLLALHKDQVDYERFPNEWLRTDFDIDIRMVIDWSDRSVPFEFQFVNPDKKFFKWTHTLEETRDRLEEEQAQGYQSEEFIIDDAPPGEWLINIQYLGDEGDYVLPPFMKYTVYKNYGTPQQTKKIKVVKLFKQSDKVTLGKVVL